MTPVPLAALAATLDRDDPPPARRRARSRRCGTGSTSCRSTAARELGPDGHPRRGGFLPPVPLPRRMWAGGRLEFRAAARASAMRSSATSTIASVETEGGTQRRARLRRSCATRSRPPASSPIVEEHDIVYREAPRAGDAPPAKKPAPADATWRRDVVPDDVLLFRYSALTFNGHRIHYDRRYVTDGRRLSRPRRARPADRDAAGRPRCATASRRARACDIRVPRGARRCSTSRRSPSADGREPDGSRPRSGRRTRTGSLAMEATATRALSRADADADAMSNPPIRIRTSATRSATSARSFPAEYFREIDEARGYPGRVRRRADQGRLARRADPAGVRRLGPRAHRGVGHHGGDQPLRRQLRRVPRPDVQHGHAAAPRLGGAEARATCRRSRAASCGCSRWRVTEPTTGTDTTKIKTDRGAQGRPLRRQRAEGLDLARPALGPHDPARAHDAARPR